MHLKRFRYLITDGHSRVQRSHWILKDHSDFRTPNLLAVDYGTAQNLLTLELRRTRSNSTGRHGNKPHHTLYRHGLTATRLAYDGKRLAFFYRKRNTANSLNNSAIGIEFDSEVFNLKQRGAVVSFNRIHS